MSNIDFDPRHIPDPAEVIGRAQRSAIGSVATSVDDNPDDVARALDISKATGTPASVVYGDLEHHEMKLKTNISTDLIRNNPDLLDYVNSHPLAAQLSNDDWGNLDTASQSMSRLRKGFLENTGDVLKDTLHFFQTGPEQYTEIANQTRASLLKQGVSPIQADAIAKNAGASAYRGEVLQNVLFAIPTMLLSPAIGAFRTYVANPIEESTGFPAQATEGYTMVALAALGMKGLNHNRVVETANKIDPYVRSGKEPPVGVDSIIDELKIKQGETEVDALIDAIKESQPSLTKERNPDMYAAFAEQHVGDQSIGIHADAVRALYKDKPSAWDDAMLGFVPGLDEKLITAEATGGYVDIPMAEYIAKVEPEVAKALEEFTRVRQGGVSKGEAKDIKAMVEAYHGSPHDFEAFSMEKIGTGEGAQSYGHGLYFAEKPEVAEQYKNAGFDYNINGKPFNPDDPLHVAASALHSARIQGEAIPKQRKAAVAILKRDVGNLVADSAIKLLESNVDIPPMERGQGNRYRVRINADKEQFLDHDTALSQQPAGKKALEKIDPTFKEHLEEILESHDQPSLEELTGNEFRQLLERVASEEELPGVPSAEGKELNHREEASKYIAQLGIPGIKYLDQGSRKRIELLADIERSKSWVDAGKDPTGVHQRNLERFQAELAKPETHNFVLFDDSLVSITHKNDQPLPPKYAVETVRDAAALVPKERKLELKRVEERQTPEGAVASGRDMGVSQASYHYEIHGPQGRVGDVWVAEERGGKRLYIDDIEGLNRGSAANTIGPRALRDLLEQLKAEFPNAEELIGYRVSGARDKAGSWETKGKVSIKLAEPTASDHLFQILLDDRIERLGEVTEQGEGFTATTIPEARWQNFERSVVEKIDAELERLNITDIDVSATHRIENAKGELVRGLYQSYENARPSILVALTADDPVGVLRHEFMHDLRSRGFLSEQEWNVLEKTAIDKDWIGWHDIKNRYEGLSEEAMLEEAIADEFSQWRRNGKPDSLHEKIFQKIDQLIEAIRAALRKLFGTENVKDIFDKIESGEVAQREPTTEFGDVTKEAKQPELPGTRRMEDRDVFAEAQAAGMTVDQYKRYMKLIAERHREDLRLESERALKDAKRRQTEKWKSDYAELRPQVTEEINERPDIATDNLLREQRLFGRKTDPVQLGAEYLTEEQKAALPKDYVAKGGAHPDDVAALTGYASGQDLVLGLVGLEMKRKESGLRPIEYNRRLITVETERQMEQRFGRLADNILDEAKEQVLSETQLDLLHEEVLAAGLKAGAEFPITKQQMKDWVAERFAGENTKDISSDKFLADAGRAGRMAEDALLKGDPAEAFRQKQRQYLAVAMTRLAKDFEKAQTQFETLAERMIRKEPKGYDKDFVNFAQGMLARSGYNIKRNLNELADSIQRSGFTSFDEFVQSKIGDGWELTVAEELRQGSGKPIEKMTTQEFMDLKESLDSLAHVAREVGKIDIAGQKLDFAEWKEGVLENIRSLPVRDKDKPVKQRLRFDASMTRMEEIAKDLDLRKELGPLFNALIRPMVESKHTEYSMLEDLSKKLREMKGDRAWQRSLKDTIPQDFFHDPYDATLFDLTRQDMIQIMLNFGNRSNIEKFTRGYVGKEEAPGFEAKLWDMIHKNANKEDWEFVQKVWDIFDGWKAQSGKLYYDLSGRQPKWIDPSPITTPHGEFAGGYYPIIYDRLRSNINAIEEKVSPNALFGSNYFRASPANHYAKERTGYADRIQFQTSIEQVAGRMQQLIHDVSYRRAVMDASKVIYDREIRAEIRKHYGMEYEKQLDPWLKDIANHFNNDEVANDFASAVMRRARANLVGHALGLNLKVILSPAVAKMNPMDAMRVWTDYKASSELAYEKSFEIPHTFRNIDRDFRERLEAAIAKGGWNEYQATAVRWAFMPVVKFEQQFRMITFVNEYQKALAKGMSEGDASVLADSYVRERHGSTGLPDMPAIMRSSEGMKIATLFYGYFSAMYNWSRQIPGNIRRAEWIDGMANLWGAVLVPAAFGAVLFNQSKEGDSWGKHIAKAILLQPLSTLVFIRDFANFYIEGNPSRTPLATAAAAVSSIISDTKNYHEGKKIKKPIQHIGNVIGLSTGLPMAQLSRTTQFAADVTKGEQRPRNIAEWARGIITGEARLKK